MKIAYILPSLANRGPIIFTQYLLSELTNYGFDIEIFYFDEGKQPSLNFNVKTTKLSYKKKFDFSKFDIVHTTMARPDIYASKYVPKEKWICSMHNYLIEDMLMLYSKIKAFGIIYLWKRAIKKCNYIITSSNQMTEYYKKILGKEKYYSMIPYGIYEKPYASIEKDDVPILENLKNQNYKIIGSVGLLIPRKGFEQLFSILEKYENTAVVIIGEGVERERLEKMIIEKKLSDRFFLLGFKNNSHNYYQYFDIYAHVSYSEGFGLAMLEAMSKKLPIICSNLPIYQDYFSEDDVALFEPGNSASLINAFDIIISNMEKYKKASYELFINKFSAEVMGKKHIDLYKFIESKNINSNTTMF